MKKIGLFIIFFLPLCLFAQNFGGFKMKNGSQHIGVVSGKLVDSKTNASLSFANVRLFRFNDILLEGTITDENGAFEFKDLALANGYLLINYMGYEEKKVEVTLNRNKKIEYLGKIKVSRSSVKLDEISINEDKPVYETKMEKIVYNAENDLNEGLDDAADVLRKAPLLSVDLEGNVSLRGSQNIKFLVNGKESTFFSGSASEALQMIPAEQVKSVEVITSPTAKYDGEGGAGIINIITQQKQISGFKATVNGSVGTRVNKQSFNVNYGRGKFGFSARARVRYGWPLSGQQTYYRFDYDNNTTLTKNAQTKGQWIGVGGSAEMYYDINPYNSIVTSIQLRGNRRTNEEWADDALYDSLLEKTFLEDIAYTVNDTVRYTDYANRMGAYEWTTDYIKKFSRHEDQELRLAFQLGGDFSDLDNTVINNPNEPTLRQTILNKNDGSPLTYTYQLDYTYPIKDKHKIELGGKFVNRNLINDYSTKLGDVYIQPYERFDYNQSLLALYTSSSIELSKKWSAVIGLRMENTKISGQWSSQLNDSWIKDSTFISDPYTNLLPSFILSRKIDRATSVKLSYSKRISRPGMRFINPNQSYNDIYSREKGSPNLTPEKTHQLELGYNSFAKKYKASYYLFAKMTDDLIESNTEVNNGIDITSYSNTGNNFSFGVNYFGSYSLKNGSVRAGLNIYTYNTTSVDIGPILLNWNIGGNYDLGKGYKAETFGFFRKKNQTAQGYTPGFSMFSIGFKKELNNKKGSIGIRFIEPFKKYKSFETELQQEGDFYLYSNRNIVFRSIGISFKYTFGELKFNAIKNRTNIKNDDMKSQDGGGEGDF